MERESYGDKKCTDFRFIVFFKKGYTTYVHRSHERERERVREREREKREGGK